MTVSDVASEMLVSERTVQRHVERFQQTGSVSPCVKKNAGTDRMLNEFDGAVLVQTILDKPGVCLRELQQTLSSTNGVQVDSSTIWRALKRLGFIYICTQENQASTNAKQ